MNKLFITALISALMLSACTEAKPVVEPEPEQETTEVEPAEEADPEVVLNIPDGWIADDSFFDEQENGLIIYHKVGETWEEEVAEGIIMMSEVENPENLEIVEYMQSEYDKCKEENPDPEDIDEDTLWIPTCWQYMIDENAWEDSTVDGYTVYRSSITGVPESGEEKEEMYVAFDGKFVKFVAGYSMYGVEERDVAKELIDSIFNNIEIK